MAADNPFAADVLSAYLIGLDIKEIPVCAEAVKRGIGPEKIDEIIIKGDDINGLVVNDFVFPKTKPINVTEKMPKFMYRVVNDVLQPYPSFNKDLCICLLYTSCYVVCAYGKSSQKRRGYDR